MGLIILSTEFDWAKKHLETTKKKLSEFYKKIKKPGDKNKPLTKTAKMLMASQALISVFTLALLIARSVNILG